MAIHLSAERRSAGRSISTVLEHAHRGNERPLRGITMHCERSISLAVDAKARLRESSAPAGEDCAGGYGAGSLVLLVGTGLPDVLHAVEQDPKPQQDRCRRADARRCLRACLGVGVIEPLPGACGRRDDVSFYREVQGQR